MSSPNKNDLKQLLKAVAIGLLFGVAGYFLAVAVMRMF